LHVQATQEWLLRDRISLVVAHRLSAIVRHDKICVILNVCLPLTHTWHSPGCALPVSPLP
jgi:hypothetical protein